MPETLTKSRFTLGLSCPQKLIYRKDPSYRNLSTDNSFLRSLAEGGFQVGELAKAHFPGGHHIDTLDAAAALDQTAQLLRQEEVVIFEAAIRWKNCFIRVDVLEKRGPFLRLHEVKAKSFDSTEASPFEGKKGAIVTGWQPYLYDVAFQKYVLKNAYPEANVIAYLMLVDKSAICPIDGLNQCFEIYSVRGRSACRQVAPIPQSVLEAGLLKSVPVDQICNQIFVSDSHGKRLKGSFQSVVASLSDICEERHVPSETLMGSCGSCEFKRLDPLDPMQSGFDECVSRVTGRQDLGGAPLIFDLWNYRGRDRALAEGVIRLTDLDDDDIKNPEPYSFGAGLSPGQRQKLQIDKAKASDDTPWFDKQGWLAEERHWRYPLHFIDFETTRVALPFFAGQRPYQSIAFQFSHHRVDEAGNVEHATQFLDTSSSASPNAEFVRALRAAIGNDEGTVFMYTPHENTTLRDIYFELEEGREDDAAALRAFLKTLVTPKKDSVEQWIPTRPLLDQCDLVKKYLYLPRTKGSNSLKYVLPAILEASDYLKAKYRDPIYGKGCSLQSLNVEPTRWVQFDESGAVRNPYTLLPNLAVGMAPDEIEALRGLEAIAEGGAALTAYSRLLYGSLSESLANELRQALLSYCELDTLAMVMVHEGMREMALSSSE